MWNISISTSKCSNNRVRHLVEIYRGGYIRRFISMVPHYWITYMDMSYYDLCVAQMLGGCTNPDKYDLSMVTRECFYSFLTSIDHLLGDIYENDLQPPPSGMYRMFPQYMRVEL